MATAPLPRPRASLAWRAAVLAALAAGVVARAIDLGGRSLWFDEAFSLRLAAGPGLPDVVRACAADTHPPLYFLLLHLWTGLFGTSEAAARGLSALAGALCVPVAYALGARWRGPRTGLAAALAMALSPFAIRQSQDARPYALLLLLASCSTLALQRWRETGARRHALAYVLASAAMTWTHLVGGAVLVAHALFVAADAVRRRRGGSAMRPGAAGGTGAPAGFSLPRWIAAVVAVLVLFAPWIPAAWTTATEKVVRFDVGDASLHGLARTLEGFGGTGAGLALVGGLAAFGVVVALLARGRSARGAVLLALVFAVPLLLPWLLAQVWARVFFPRVTVAATFALAALAGAGAAAVLPRGSRWRAGVALLLVAVASGVGLRNAWGKPGSEPWRDVAHDVAVAARVGDRVLADTAVEADLLERYLPARSVPAESWQELGSSAVEGTRGQAGLWFVRSAHTRHEAEIAAALSRWGWKPAGKDLRRGSLSVSRYSR